MKNFWKPFIEEISKLRPHLRRDRRPVVPGSLHPVPRRPHGRHGPREEVQGQPGVRRLCQGCALVQATRTNSAAGWFFFVYATCQRQIRFASSWTVKYQ